MRVAIIGGTGYGAVELARILKMHPYAELTTVISHSQSGNSLAEVYPHMTGIIEQSMKTLDVKALSKTIDLVFFATPSNVSKEIVPEFLQYGVTCIDLSGDFRLKSPELYAEWYQAPAAASVYLDKAVYGLSEIYQENIKKAKLIANPGCYPTATLLGLIPIIQKEWIDPNSVIVDGKTGVSGAGRGLSLNVHFSEMNENVKAYKLGTHKHIPEMEQVLKQEANTDIQVTFTPHIVPMTRGIMTTIYADLTESVDQVTIQQLYHEFYQTQPFVRIRPEGILPTTKEVYGSNYCDIAIHLDKRTDKLTIVSVIDNLVKGAAGQAIQNMNIINGWEETAGLEHPPIYP
ncbi:N-acetyl-gamma-glutamyl-phosphate reductase [Paraliobacillus quinghaiensis]|uniref:N-acetyl-gamma-glutamyl-phosphate reductase n=1 Tax=Paraliobacillus quinghaiensis TaxID=470815 RepID=A0A917TX09_9BACI|nr:N-acetyl-gamma-glutamyl-phosphate reductase [Paraliobacillus quinghaiensis]GGM41709.1 N-acetyl-gamma-glutamyl-phosphate reductase [Paraliobacillus quinghaiensis]